MLRTILCRVYFLKLFIELIFELRRSVTFYAFNIYFIFAVLYYVFTGKGEQVSIGWYVHVFISSVISYLIDFSERKEILNKMSIYLGF